MAENIAINGIQRTIGLAFLAYTIPTIVIAFLKLSTITESISLNFLLKEVIAPLVLILIALYLIFTKRQFKVFNLWYKETKEENKWKHFLWKVIIFLIIIFVLLVLFVAILSGGFS